MKIVWAAGTGGPGFELPTQSMTVDARPCVLGKGGYDAVCSMRFRQSQKPALQCGIAPTLRTEREEWGTHFVGRIRERLGHPPYNTIKQRTSTWIGEIV